MRPCVYRIARAMGVTGRVRNDAAGVTIDAFGTREALDAFVARLRAEPPPAATFERFESRAIPAEAAAEFVIVGSEGSLEKRVSIPPDLATCADCLAEVRDPADRRHRYPFTNCTNCGPRFTIARDVPYDRPATTMASFAMCAACRREYDDPLDRRFHAQPIACPECGPGVALVSADGAAVAKADPIAAAARALRAGAIVAVKGLGGFHLACDAGSSAAVRRLRERKRREEKPFAVMVDDLAAAEALAELAPAERALLAAVERPIVLVRRRAGAPLAPEVAPDSPLVGLLLAYTPLHHLLLAEAARPLVMTSGNLSEEPIAYRNEEALARLRGIADLFLAHDREIETRADDSVARVIAGRPVLLRRSRGWVPRPIALRGRLERSVLACGADLKNTFCIAHADEAVLGPHIGDLDNLETYASLESAVARMERFLSVRPAIVAHDLHPGYLSTRYARERASALGVKAVAVQHHHAHVAAAMAAHRLEGPVLGVAWDGTGYGPDGTAWGGELLVARFGGFERVATLRPVPLAGGERAIREPWRVALALLDDAFGGEPPLGAIPLFRSIPDREIALVRRMIASGLNAPLAHGAGRYFDAVGALALGRGVSRHEAQVAMALENAAAPGPSGAYPFAIDEARSPWELDLRPVVRAAAADLRAGRPPGEIAAWFHDTMAEAVVELVRRASARVAKLPVVLAGGCFQNARLAEGVLGALTPAFEVYLHGEVPPGDGGIAVGQALVADAVAKA